MPDSFAFSAPSPIQTNTQPVGGNTPQAGVIGGDSQGGVVRATPFTYSDGNDGIPQFLQSLVEPYVKAKQQEKFDAGADAVANGAGIKEIASSDNGIGRLFGPSFYHQGAAMYDSVTKVAQLHDDIANDPELYKLDDASRTAEVSKRGQALLTGDPITDHLIQTGLMTNRPAVMATLAKKNVAYGNAQAINKQSAAVDAQGGQLQSIVLQNNALSSPDDGSQLNVQTATHNFVQSFAKPYGMTDESYATFIQNSAINLRAKGNFVGYEALKSSGLLSPGGPLNDAQIDRIEKGYDKDASHVLADAAFDPDINKALVWMNYQITTGGFHGPRDILESAQTVNDLVRRKTGMTDKPIITGDDVEAMQKEYAAQGFAAHLRLQSRQWELEDRQATWAHEDAADQAKAVQAVAAASGAISAGNVATSLAIGAVHSDDVNLVFQRQFNKGNITPLVQNFVNSKYVNENVANQIQSSVASSIGTGPTKSFDAAYKQWQALSAANPGAASAYMGSYAAKMIAYGNYVNGGETSLSAYAQSFGRSDPGGRPELPAGVKQTDAAKGVDSALQKDDTWLFGMLGSRTPLASSSRAMLGNVLLGPAAAFASQSGLDMATATTHVLQQKLASGEIERAGPFAWTNPQGAPKLSSYLGLPDDSTDKLVTQVAEKKLTDAGYRPDGGIIASPLMATGLVADKAHLSGHFSNGNYNVLRYKGPAGEPMLYIQTLPGDGSIHKDVFISLHDLQAQNKENASHRSLSREGMTKFTGMPAAR
jgi:hypothetical protein